jgi:hypothetical protein
LLHGQEGAQPGHGVWQRPQTNPAVVPGEPGPPHTAFGIGRVGEPAGGAGRLPGRHLIHPCGDQLRVHGPSGVGVQMGGLGDQQPGQVFRDLTGGQQAETAGQVLPQIPRHGQPPGAVPRPGFGGHPDLVTDAFAQPAVIHPGGLLLGHLGLSEPHHLDQLSSRRGSLDRLQCRDPLDPGCPIRRTVPGGQPAEHCPLPPANPAPHPRPARRAAGHPRSRKRSCPETLRITTDKIAHKFDNSGTLEGDLPHICRARSGISTFE